MIIYGIGELILHTINKRHGNATEHITSHNKVV